VDDEGRHPDLAGIVERLAGLPVLLRIGHHTPYKRFVELGEGTHTVMMEKNRMQFFREVAAFLTESEQLSAEVARFLDTVRAA
jgi:hypothetical protein